MRKINFILCLVPIVGQCFTGVNNPPFKPQLKINIPTVIAPAAVVVDDALTVNPYRSLKYCDFVLKAIDQTGKH